MDPLAALRGSGEAPDLLRFAQRPRHTNPFEVQGTFTTPDGVVTEREKKREKRMRERKRLRAGDGSRKHDYAFEPPFRAQLVGASGKGKTHWLLQYLRKYGEREFDHLIWWTIPRSAKQKALRELEDRWGRHMTMIIGDGPAQRAEVDDILDHNSSEGKQTLIVLDDMMIEAQGSQHLADLYIGGRHEDASIMELSQRVFQDGSRVKRLQSDYYVVFDFPVKSEARELFRQLTCSPLAQQLLTRKYRECTDKRYGCLIYDAKSVRSQKLPLRVRDTKLTNLVPDLWDVDVR